MEAAKSQQPNLGGGCLWRPLSRKNKNWGMPMEAAKSQKPKLGDAYGGR
jgi:hypothetical protein